MELKNFVASAMQQIIDGVIEAQAHATANGAAVNPAFNLDGTHGDVMGSTSEGVRVLKVQFDVAVTAVESSDVKGGAKVEVAGFFSAGGGAGLAERSEKVSRLQFIVPLALPDDEATRTAAKQKAAVSSASFKAVMKARRPGY